ncbi:MAG: hypothetical protein CBD88_07965 [Flavobacteriales bacterium TMED228]|nr:MAG: hypothetical protein CBD88_07965 [Flavobacteriales bacterium TMED228]|tara:strand:- start:117 stop:902 length:786 start_codon:yes stop_codon:yes gene_type:complete
MAETQQEYKSQDLLSVEELASEVPTPEAPSEPVQPEPSPSKYAGKSREQLEQMLDETKSMVGAQSKEVKAARDELAAMQATDDYIKRQLDPAKEKPKELDWYGNPEEATKQAISENPKIAALEQKLAKAETDQKRAKMDAAHPDWVEVMDSGDFSTFVKGDVLAKATLDQVASTQNIDLAIELVSRFKAAQQKQTESVRREAVNKAATGSVSSTSGERVTGKPIFASTLRKLMREKRSEYDALVKSGAIGKLYEEGRVIED